MATQTEARSYRSRELERAEEKLREARAYFEQVDRVYRAGERTGEEATSPFRYVPSDVDAAKQRLEQAERAVAAWRLLADQPTAGAHLTANTPISYNGRSIDIGERFVVPDDDVAVIAQLLNGDAASVAEPLPEPSAAAQLGSKQLRARIAELEERQQRRREAHAIAEADLRATQDALRELHVASELDGQKPASGAVAKAEARVAEGERAVRAKRAALDAELARTEPDREKFAAALTEAVALEAQAERDAAEAKAEAAMSESRRRTVRAYVELANALAAEHRIARDLERTIAETAAATGIRMSRDVMIVDVDGARSMRQILDFLGMLRETKACGLIPRARYGSWPGEHVYEVAEVSAS